MPIRSVRLKCISTHLVVMPNAQHWLTAIALAGSALSGCSLVERTAGTDPQATDDGATGRSRSAPQRATATGG